MGGMVWLSPVACRLLGVYLYLRRRASPCPKHGYKLNPKLNPLDLYCGSTLDSEQSPRIDLKGRPRPYRIPRLSTQCKAHLYPSPSSVLGLYRTSELDRTRRAMHKSTKDAQSTNP
jgi:hypothetical protein